MIIFVYDRFGVQVDTLWDFVEFVHDDELGQFDSIEFMTPGERVQKGDYLLWRDQWNIWHEHIVASVTLTHKSEAIYQTVYAPNSVTELNMSYINEVDCYSVPASTALSRALNNTRWTNGKVDAIGSGYQKYYHETVYEAIVDFASEWAGGELSTTIKVGPEGVTSRAINYESKRGEDNGLLFTYGFDMDNIERIVSLDDVFTRIHCFGKGELLSSADDTGMQNSRYGRRISFASINNGKDYVEDDAAKQKWGVIGKDGTLQHAEGVFVWDNVEDPRTLLELGKARLDEVKVPRITYTANIAVLADAGMTFSNVRTGDTIYIRDEVLDERLTGRIVRVRRYLNDARATEITLGNVVRTSSDLFRQTRDAMSALNKRSSSWDSAAEASESWLDNMLDSLNEAADVNGGYVHITPEDGITVYDRPLDEGPTMAIQLKGGMFRIANSKKSNGEWNWRTFGTGDGFTADVLNAGTIRGGNNEWNLSTGDLLFMQGIIRNSSGKSIWDLTNDKFTTDGMTANNMTANYMTAVEMTATGSLRCGGPNGVYMEMREGIITGGTGIQKSGHLKIQEIGSSGDVAELCGYDVIRFISKEVKVASQEGIYYSTVDSKSINWPFIDGLTNMGTYLQYHTTRIKVEAMHGFVRDLSVTQEGYYQA